MFICLTRFKSCLGVLDGLVDGESLIGFELAILKFVVYLLFCKTEVYFCALYENSSAIMMSKTVASTKAMIAFSILSKSLKIEKIFKVRKITKNNENGFSS